MTVFFPDVSEYTPVSLAGAPVAIARATIGLVKDARYDAFVADAGRHGVPLLAYHFLNSELLGAPPEKQAEFCFSVVGTRPLMLDHEPNRGRCASLYEGIRFIDRYRSLGGVVNLAYLPRWSWSSWMGSTSLRPLTDRGVYLVASNYTAYSDTGPGWAGYGGGVVVQWQYTDRYLFNSTACDFNAYRGDVASYVRLVGATNEGELMGATDNIIYAWSQGLTTGSGGEDVEPVKWRMRDEVWQKNVSDELQQILDAVKAANTPPPVDVKDLATDIANALIAAHTNGLTQADLDAVGTVVEARLADKLSQVRLTTG